MPRRRNQNPIILKFCWVRISQSVVLRYDTRLRSTTQVPGGPAQSGWRFYL